MPRKGRKETMFEILFGWLWSERGSVVMGDDDSDDSDDSGADKGDADADADADADKGDTEKEDASKKTERTSKFKEYQTKAQKVDKLLELGILQENEDGEFVLNPKVTEKEKKEVEDEDLHFKESEIHKDSWPLAQKINKMFDSGIKNSAIQAFHLLATQARLKVVEDYPEFLQKDSPLKKKALSILKDDPEFKKTYRGNPEAVYWAVKRAAEALENKTTTKPQPKKNAFIIGKGDIETGGKKVVDISKLSEADLDKLEKEENERLNKQKK